MVYKLANVSDLTAIPNMKPRTEAVLRELTSVLTYEYGADRAVDTADGGYVLYATPGTPVEEIKVYFDYSTHCIEYVNRDLKAEPPLCIAFYFLTNEYSVTIVMSIDDAPPEISAEYQEGY